MFKVAVGLSCLRVSRSLRDEGFLDDILEEKESLYVN